MAQAREQQLNTVAKDTIHSQQLFCRQITSGFVPLPSPSQPTMEQIPLDLPSSTTASATTVVHQEEVRNKTCKSNLVKIAGTRMILGGDGQQYSSELLEKLNWAVQELRRTASVEYSIQLCQLVKSCADALSSLRAAFDS